MANPRLVGATQMILGGDKSQRAQTNPNQGAYLKGLQQERGELHKKRYIDSLEKEKQNTRNNATRSSSTGIEDSLTTTGDRILNKRIQVQNKHRKRLGKSGYIGRKSLGELSDSFSEQDGKNADPEYQLETKGGSSHEGLTSAITNYKRIKAGQASWFIGYTVLPFWVPQICFWMIGLVGVGGESIPVANYTIPGETIFTVMNYLVITIGIITMMYAFAIYVSRRINAFGGIKGLIFCFCVAFYCTPFLNAFPWVIVWLVATTYLQRPSLLTRIILH